VSINLRHAAALALMGWYLVTPHTLPNSTQPNLFLPISEWSRIGPVASKSDCETRLSAARRKSDDPAAREQIKKQLPRVRAEIQREWPDQKMAPDSYFDKDYWDDLRRMLKLSQCMASDDPRLKEK
jgi:hypothetical protein